MLKRCEVEFLKIKKNLDLFIYLFIIMPCIQSEANLIAIYSYSDYVFTVCIFFFQGSLKATEIKLKSMWKIFNFDLISTRLRRRITCNQPVISFPMCQFLLTEGFAHLATCVNII